MKYNIPDRVLRDIALFSKENNIRRVVLFGSRARGTHTDRSNIDIAVSGGDFDSFYWAVRERTHSLLNFSNCLNVLKTADWELAGENVIYRTGVIGQFNQTFELAWKALQEILKIHGAEAAETGSPREILQLGYQLGFVEDSAVWLTMLKKRNISVHIYNEDEIDEMILLIRDSFIPAFTVLEKTLEKKLGDAEDEWK